MGLFVDLIVVSVLLSVAGAAVAEWAPVGVGVFLVGVPWEVSRRSRRGPADLIPPTSARR